MTEEEIIIHRALEKIEIIGNRILDSISIDFISDLCWWYDKDLTEKQEKFLYFLFFKNRKIIKSYKAILRKYDIEEPHVKRLQEIIDNPELSVSNKEAFNEIEKFLINELQLNYFTSSDIFNSEKFTLGHTTFRKYSKIILKKNKSIKISFPITNNLKHSIYCLEGYEDQAIIKAKEYFKDYLFSKHLVKA